MSDLPFPKSLPDFQRLFPDDAACAKYLETIRLAGNVCRVVKLVAKSKPAQVAPTKDPTDYDTIINGMLGR
jgi:hypothetical protein